MTIEEMLMNVTEEELDKLVKSDDWAIRCLVVERGRDKDLDILVHDENWLVRIKVARQERKKYLDILVNDENRYVRRKAKIIREYLKNKEKRNNG